MLIWLHPGGKEKEAATGSKHRGFAVCSLTYSVANDACLVVYHASLSDVTIQQ